MVGDEQSNRSATAAPYRKAKKVHCPGQLCWHCNILNPSVNRKLLAVGFMRYFARFYGCSNSAWLVVKTLTSRDWLSQLVALSAQREWFAREPGLTHASQSQARNSASLISGARTSFSLPASLCPSRSLSSSLHSFPLCETTKYVCEDTMNTLYSSLAMADRFRYREFKVTPGLSYVGNVGKVAVGRRVFSGFFRFLAVAFQLSPYSSTSLPQVTPHGQINSAEIEAGSCKKQEHPLSSKTGGVGQGAAVVQRLGSPLPTKENKVVRFPARALLFSRTWDSCRTMQLFGGFSQGSPISPRPCIPALLQAVTVDTYRKGMQTSEDPFMRTWTWTKAIFKSEYEQWRANRGGYAVARRGCYPCSYANPRQPRERSSEELPSAGRTRSLIGRAWLFSRAWSLIGERGSVILSACEAAARAMFQFCILNYYVANFHNLISICINYLSAALTKNSYLLCEETPVPTTAMFADLIETESPGYLHVGNSADVSVCQRFEPRTSHTPDCATGGRPHISETIGLRAYTSPRATGGHHTVFSWEQACMGDVGLRDVVSPGTTTWDWGARRYRKWLAGSGEHDAMTRATPSPPPTTSVPLDDTSGQCSSGRPNTLSYTLSTAPSKDMVGANEDLFGSTRCVGQFWFIQNKLETRPRLEPKPSEHELRVLATTAERLAREEIWAAPNSEVLRASEGAASWVWSSAGTQGRRKREISEKTDRPAASLNMNPKLNKLNALQLNFELIKFLGGASDLSHPHPSPSLPLVSNRDAISSQCTCVLCTKAEKYTGVNTSSTEGLLPSTDKKPTQDSNPTRQATFSKAPQSQSRLFIVLGLRSVGNLSPSQYRAALLTAVGLRPLMDRPVIAFISAKSLQEMLNRLASESSVDDALSGPDGRLSSCRTKQELGTKLSVMSMMKVAATQI
ncbi:hypothetical protein PR048_003878 [Dryococelus australis]|uniref:Uncharacterized protein n=1 Tax=Dryococelus australis TaxID=614101 RepID=A0ABQ9IP94_9NEOP|nr:hypothetical protein PR048_003878 [Dryococelus australis]